MQFSYSRVDLYDRCPYHFKLKYIDNLTEIPDFSPTSPLILGHALHTGIETNNTVMLKEYFNAYPVVTDEIINESIKLEIMLKKVKAWLSQFDEMKLIHEYEINTPEYKGFVDLMFQAPDKSCMVVDFKYSNSIEHYKQSGQLHVYQHYLEEQGFNVQRLGFLFIENVNLKRGKNEDLYQYRKRLSEACESASITFVPIEFDEQKVLDFQWAMSAIKADEDFEKNPCGECFACKAIEAKKKGNWTPFSAPDYLETIQNENGEIIEMIELPTAERVDISKVEKRVFWIYGAPFSGKTFFANKFPNPLMLNTDGNVRFVDAPRMSIADQVEVDGRITRRTLAWDIFKDIISELEKKNNDFETIIIDLLEDTFAHCRTYMYEKLGIEHESDNSFKAWDMVRTEFLNVMKRIIHLPYTNIILISHEDTSKDVTKKSGDKITSISPNIQDKVANKVAGMVDIVARIVADGDERKMVFKAQDYMFSGGRLPNLPVTEIDLDYDELVELYDTANKNLKTPKERPSRTPKKEEPKHEVEEVIEEETPKRKRRSREVVEEDDVPPGEQPEMEVEEAPANALSFDHVVVVEAEDRRKKNEKTIKH